MDKLNSEMTSSLHSGRPESEFSIECFQNYAAPEVFIQGLAGVVNQTDVEIMIRAQKQMLQRFEKTNEMLLNCNALSASRLKVATEDFKKHTKLLTEMKKDLDYIFKKVRVIKTKLSSQYPTAFAEAQLKTKKLAFDEEEEVDSATKVEALEIGDEAASATCTPLKRLEKQHSSKDKKKPKEVSYMKMDQSPENGAKTNRRSLISNHSSSTENSNNSNDSSDFSETT